MKVINLQLEVDAIRTKDCLSQLTRAQIAEEIRKEQGTPMNLDICNGVKYDSRSNCYIGSFEAGGGKMLSLRLSEDVATFLAGNIGEIGTWAGRMEKGILVDVVLYTI